MIPLVLDTQADIMTNELYAFDTFVQNVSALIAAARTAGTEVVYARHDDGEELTKGINGFEIYNLFSPQSSKKKLWWWACKRSFALTQPSNAALSTALS